MIVVQENLKPECPPKSNLSNYVNLISSVLLRVKII